MEQGNERLQKILSQAGIASRRSAEALILEGRVRVNGKVVRELGVKADPVRDEITVDGRSAIPTRLRYVAYHKPVGVVSSMSDPEGRPSLGDIARRMRDHLFPVGRLDFDSSGLVLLTNDGEVAQRLSHPRYQIPKVYRVKVRGHPEAKALKRLRQGIRLADGPTAPARVELEEVLEKKSRFRVTIAEGRQRQVRRMFEAVGHPVDKLSRVAIGPIRLGGLASGKTRELNESEVRSLQAVAAGKKSKPDEENAPVRVKRRASRGQGSASSSPRIRSRPRR